jgi:hypothetical protein
LRSLPEAGRPREQVENQNWDFLTGWLVPSAGQKIPVQLDWYFPLQKIPLAENTFLQAGQRAENTKEKSRQCFTHEPKAIRSDNWLFVNIITHM